MKNKFIGLIVVISLVLIVLFSFIIYNEWPLMTGNKIVLATQPVDPFDPFMGQYITINYDISTISNTGDFKEKDTIYVSLKEDEKGIYRYQSASKLKPQNGDFIKGIVTSVYYDSVRVQYGIEQYFFERNANLPTRDITVEVSVASSGRAKISQLLYGGKPINIQYDNFSIRS